jgi:transmembrane sensor
MSEREQEVELALQRVNIHWNAQRTERVLAHLHQRIRRRALAVRMGVGALGVAALAAAFGPRLLEGYRSPAVARAEQAVAADVERPPLAFSEGSKMIALDESTRVSVLEAVPERIVAGIDRGSVRFEVSHHPERVFRAQAGDVSVEALGTIFTVERLEPGVWVSVTRGRVRVQWPGGSRELAVGEADWFPPRTGSTVAAPPVAPAEATTAAAAAETTARSPSSEAPRAQRWKDLAAQGKHLDAYPMTPAPGQVRDAEELLMAADVARLSGHPRQAVPYLERVLTQFRRDSRAPVAAFSLGRILMTSLGSPAKAAVRFAEVRSLAPSGSLAEDALAREVEAWYLAGQFDRARQRAQEYMRLYPQGSRAASVRKYGGVE